MKFSIRMIITEPIIKMVSCYHEYQLRSTNESYENYVRTWKTEIDRIASDLEALAKNSYCQGCGKLRGLQNFYIGPQRYTMNICQECLDYAEKDPKRLEALEKIFVLMNWGKEKP